MKEEKKSRNQKEKYLSDRIYQQLLTYPKFGLTIEERIKILTDLTCIPVKKSFQLSLGFSEADIVFYNPVNSEDVNPMADLISFHNSSKIKKGELAVPYVILELKSGKITSDNIRSRDIVAAKIREVFPFCAYYFIAEETTKENATLLRQGKNFTNYFIYEDKIEEEHIEHIYKSYIKPHIKNLKSQLAKLEEQ